MTRFNKAKTTSRTYKLFMNLHVADFVRSQSLILPFP